MSSDIDWPASASALALHESRASRPVVIGFTVTLALIAIILCMVYTTTHATADAEMRVEQTRDAATSLNDAADAFYQMDQANGRYLLTGSTRYRSARDAGADAVNNRLARLNELLPDDSVQRERLVAIQPLVSDLLSRLQTMRTINAARFAEIESLTDEISNRFAEMRREEGVLLTQQYADLKRSIRAQPTEFFGLLGLAALALCALYAMAADYIKKRGDAGKMLTETLRRPETQYDPHNASVARALCDVRSALTAILGYCDLPLESATPAQERFDSIRRQASQIVSAVSDTLNLPGDVQPSAPLIAHALPEISPAVAVSSNADAAAASPATMFSSPMFTGRVLLAEDNPDLQQVIKFYLTEIGADVTIVPDGQVAREQALLAWKQENAFDLILMDVQMPKSDGRSATIMLRDAGYTNPIVALTANTTEQERSRCFAAGCNGFLTKPVDHDEFHQTMRRYLKSNVPAPAAPISDQPVASTDAQFAALRESFQAELPSRIIEIGSAVVAGDLPLISDLSHQLKGTAGCFGLIAICDSAAVLQSAAELPEPRETIQRCFEILTEKSIRPPTASAA